MSRAAVFLAAGLVLGAACLFAQGPLPGDVVATSALQSVLGVVPDWAEFLTSTAKAPLLWLTLCLAALLAYVRSGWLSAAAPPLALLFAQLLDAALRALVFAPKPDAALVAVAAPSAASGFPSTFGLVYGALFGAVLFASAREGEPRVATSAFAVALIGAGTCARVVLGGHWASQILASLLLAFSIAIAVHVGLHAWQHRARTIGRA